MSPVVKRERTLGSIPSTATNERREIEMESAPFKRPRAIVPRTGRSATNAVVRVQFLPVVRRLAKPRRGTDRSVRRTLSIPACQTRDWL